MPPLDLGTNAAIGALLIGVGAALPRLAGALRDAVRPRANGNGDVPTRLKAVEGDVDGLEAAIGKTVDELHSVVVRVSAVEVEVRAIGRQTERIEAAVIRIHERLDGFQGVR